MRGTLFVKAKKKEYICVWGYMLKKIRIGRVFFLIFFFSLFIFIQRAYGTLKQNLVKFQYTEVIN